jgi:asparagine synthase (glutamine-hydrolysing)
MLNRLYGRAKQFLHETSLPPIVRAVRADSLTYLNHAALDDLFKRVRTIETSGREGILIEAGCALGGSAIVIATAKSRQRPFFVYDVFGMIPPPSANDDADVQERYAVISSGQSSGLQGNKYYGYEDNLLDKVSGNFHRHGVSVEANNVHLVRGLFQETLNVNDPVALAHVDGDWFESVMTCLQRIEPHLIEGGVIVIDDYDDWSGCRKAVDEYFRDKRDRYEFVRKARLHIVRKPGR